MHQLGLSLRSDFVGGAFAVLLASTIIASGCGEPEGSSVDAGGDGGEVVRDAAGSDAAGFDAAGFDAAWSDAASSVEEDAGAPPDAAIPPCPEGDGPTVTAVVGAVVHGAEVAIHGCRFGDDPTPTPLIWDDFENGSVGALVGHGWQQQREGEDHPIYTDRQSYGQGALSLTNHVEPNVNDAPGCQFCGAYQVVEPSNELYVSYRFRFDVTGDDYGVLKLARLASNPNYDGVDFYNGVGTLRYQYQPHADWGYADFVNAPGESLQMTIGGVSRGEWHRVEMYFRLSSPAGAANGAVYVAIDGEHDPVLDLDDAVTLESGYPTQLHSLLLPLMLANPRNDGVFDLYVDDVYLDATRARVEIGDAPTWSETAHREIQPTTAWSPTGIRATVNQGGFPACESAYLYVVSADGAVNENGYPIALGDDCE